MHDPDDTYKPESTEPSTADATAQGGCGQAHDGTSGYDPKSFPDNLTQCHAIIGALLSEVEKKEVFIRKLQHQIEQLLRHRYGQRADRINPNQLVFEAMQEILKEDARSAKEAPAPEAPAQPKATAPRRPGHGRGALPASLPRERVEYPIPPEKLICTGCGRPKERIREDVTEVLEYRPASLYVRQDVRPTYGCKHCASSVVTAAKPMQPIEKGLPGPGLLAYVATSKYADHLPLHRLEAILERQGVTISRKTMCDWMAAAARVAEPLYELMKVKVLESKVIHTDDTPVPVQDAKRTKTRTGRIWVYVGDTDHPYTVFDYTADRSREGPERFLSGFKGYLQADAYTGYNRLYARGDVVEVACWAHVRRKMVEAQTSDLPRAVVATAWIKMLYDIEEEARPLSSTERCSLREAKARPLLEKFESWLREQQREVLPKSPIGEAIGYALNNWQALVRYVEDGDLSVDNNRAERALRPVVVGRGNWLFLGSDRGGRTAAVLMSLVHSCKAHRVDPFAYLRDVFERISAHPARRLGEFLPDRWTEAQEAALPSAPAPAAASP